MWDKRFAAVFGPVAHVFAGMFLMILKIKVGAICQAADFLEAEGWKIVLKIYRAFAVVGPVVLWHLNFLNFIFGQAEFFEPAVRIITPFFEVFFPVILV